MVDHSFQDGDGTNLSFCPKSGKGKNNTLMKFEL